MPLSQHSGNPVSGDITGDGQSVGTLSLSAGESASLSVSGTFVSTIKLQRLLPNESTWRNVPDANGNHFTAPDEKTYIADERCSLRFATETGDYTSGTATCRLGKE